MPAPAKSSPQQALASDLIDRVEELLLGVAQAGQAVEVDPHRGRLFELFVMADATGFLEDGSDPDLSSDGIAKELAARWDIARHVGGGLANPNSVPPAQLLKLRLLWSFMRMWMEWSYAWDRWAEFHPTASATDAEQSASDPE